MFFSPFSFTYLIFSDRSCFWRCKGRLADFTIYGLILSNWAHMCESWFLRLFQHTGLEHTPLATFTNRLCLWIPFIVGQGYTNPLEKDGGWLLNPPKWNQNGAKMLRKIGPKKTRKRLPGVVSRNPTEFHPILRRIIWLLGRTYNPYLTAFTSRTRPEMGAKFWCGNCWDEHVRGTDFFGWKMVEDSEKMHFEYFLWLIYFAWSLDVTLGQFFDG